MSLFQRLHSGTENRIEKLSKSATFATPNSTLFSAKQHNNNVQGVSRELLRLDRCPVPG